MKLSLASPRVGIASASAFRDETPGFQEQIARRAYELWQQAGSPDGLETNFWLEAEQQLTVERTKRETFPSRK